MPKKIKFIFVGKIKKRFWKEVEGFYEKRLSPWFVIQKIIIKDGDSSLCIEDRVRIESDRILKKVQSNDILICLDEMGKMFSSGQFAKKLTKWIESPGKVPCFAVGGPYGIHDTLKKRSDFLMSLSPMTFPHEMARIILLEQIYRAKQIINNSPYHH